MNSLMLVHLVKMLTIDNSILLSKAPYRLNQKELEEFFKKLNDLLSHGYIWQNKFSYGASILFVDKKDDKLKMCINYRALNKIIIINNYPLPRINDMLDRLNGQNTSTKLIWSWGTAKYALRMKMYKKQQWGSSMAPTNSWWCHSSCVMFCQHSWPSWTLFSMKS